MLCIKKAVLKSGAAFPCGQCPNCRINRKRDWQARLLLEAATNEHSMFVTLTHADLQPFVGPPHPLRKVVIQLFLKRLRKATPGIRIRYFIVGEYGTKKGRAHYHALLFSSHLLGREIITEAWGRGSIDIGDVEPASIDYVIGYLFKGKSEPVWPIEKVFPQFRLFSMGIGRGAYRDLLVGSGLSGSFRVFGRTWPVGKYYRAKAKKEGVSVADSSEAFLQKVEQKELLALYGSLVDIPQDAREKVIADRAVRSAELQARHTRDYYKSALNLGKKRNETF